MLQTPEEIIAWLDEHQVKNYQIRKKTADEPFYYPAWVVDVNQSVDLRYKNLSELPVQFGSIQGFFDISGNALTSLKGSPYLVTDSFIAMNNQLQDLEFGPQRVHKTYNVSDNKLTALKCSLVESVEHFNVSYNLLSSLEGAPFVQNTLDADYNQLETLIGTPDGMTSLHVNYNKLRSLEGCPQKISEFLECAHNLLSDLKGAPKNIYELDASNNELRTLEGCPDSIHCLRVSNNHLTSLEYAPDMPQLFAEHNELVRIKHPPQVSEIFSLSHNPLEYLGYVGEVVNNLDIDATLIKNIDGIAGHIISLTISELTFEMIDSIMDRGVPFLCIIQNSDSREDYDSKGIESLYEILALKNSLDDRLEEKMTKKGRKI